MPRMNMSETAFEDLIVDELVKRRGWREGHPRRYDRQLGLYPEDVLSFVKATQPATWDKLVAAASSEQAAGESLLKRLADQLTRRGTVEVLRSGITEKNLRVRLCFFKPNLTIDPTAGRLYDANVLRVIRQVHHDPTRPNDSIDLVLFVNGIPTATTELKNRWSGQQVDDAIEQYQRHRDPANVLLGERALVHFAMDAELAYMTTKLAGEDTVFLPFNQGSGGPGRPGGAGNPEAADGRHPTAYVWEQVWQRDAWLELLEDFVFVERPDGRGKTPTVIFPRYHQWEVVRAAAHDALTNGAGRSYLIQHSAGSGKTKEIAWLAHDLSTLHRDDAPVFDKVVVITDRRVLDAQLQRQVRAFAQTATAVQEIEEDSDQLLDALTNRTVRVIITTLQKFPFVLRKLTDDSSSDLKSQSYAVIVDEAHSSQTGDAAADLKQVMGAREADVADADDGVPAELLARVAARGQQPNVSYFAFTATPKAKTLELFGEPTADGFEPFHVYAMRQAIEERYILDVLRNYTTYQQLYRLEATQDELLPADKTNRRLAQFAQLHPHAKAQKAEVIVEHYKRVVRPQLGGRGKAMVVCSGREDAVRYKQALERYIAEHDVTDCEVLVAFSGEVTITDPNAEDFGSTYRESQLNARDGKPLADSRLPKEFDQDRYGILVVAEKYQTGFDQPKLVGMYVDKPLSGIGAVQTLSRLNRTFPGKRDTFIVDFVNRAEDIHAAFEQYFGATEALPSDPNVLSDAAQTVLDWEVIEPDEITALANALYDPDATHHALSAATRRSFETASDLPEDHLRRFRADLDRFVRFYRFLSQIVPFLSADLESLYEFCRALALRLGVRSQGGLNVAESVQLTHFRLEETGTHDLSVDAASAAPAPLTALPGDGTGTSTTPGGHQIQLSLLEELVALFNQRFGGVLTEADALPALSQLIDTAARIGDDKGLADQARANEFEDFERDKRRLVVGATLRVRDLNERVLGKLLDDEVALEQTTRLVMRSLYDRYREQEDGDEHHDGSASVRP